MRALRRVERLLLWPPKPPLLRSGYVRMNPDGRLREYPYIVVRFACRECPRMGRYRLAVLAERFGADADWRPCWRRFRRAARGSGKAIPDGDAERIILTCPRPSRRTCQPISGLSGCG